MLDRWRSVLLTELSSLDYLKAMTTAIPRRTPGKNMNSHFIFEISNYVDLFSAELVQAKLKHIMPVLNSKCLRLSHSTKCAELISLVYTSNLCVNSYLLVYMSKTIGQVLCDKYICGKANMLGYII